MPTFSTQPTPNPDSIKLIAAGEKFIDEGMASFSSAEEAEDHPLARRLFSVTGVTNVFIMPDFLTITKNTGTKWDLLMPKVKQVLGDHFAEASDAEQSDGEQSDGEQSDAEQDT